MREEGELLPRGRYDTADHLFGSARLFVCVYLTSTSIKYVASDGDPVPVSAGHVSERLRMDRATKLHSRYEPDVEPKHRDTARQGQRNPECYRFGSYDGEDRDRRRWKMPTSTSAFVGQVMSSVSRRSR